MTGDPVQTFRLLYCGAIAAQSAIQFADQLRFFRTTPSRLYGPPPKLLGRLTLPIPRNELWWVVTGLAFIGSLVAVVAGIAPRVSLSVALIFYFLYFPAILPLSYIRRKANLIPIILAILASPSDSKMMMVTIALASVYLSAGVEKLRTSGIRWRDGDSLKAYLMESYLRDDSRAALWLARRADWCRWLSTFVLAWELSFWLVIPFPSLVWFYVPAGLAFHAGTAITMRIHYWIYFLPLYLVFIAPWLSRFF